MHFTSTQLGLDCTIPLMAVDSLPPNLGCRRLQGYGGDVGLLVLREEGFKSLCHTFAVIQVRLGAVRNMAIPDFLGGRT